MQILTQKPLSFKIDGELFLSEDRIDVLFFYPKYLEVEKTINNLKNVVSMGDISKNIKSSAFYSSIALKYSQSGIPFIRVSDIKHGNISNENLVFIDENILESNKSIRTVSPNSLVISKGGTIGKIGVTPSDFKKYALSRDVIGIELKEKVIAEYVSLFLNSHYGLLQLERVKQGQIQSHLTIEGIKKIRIPLHPIQKQKKIVEIMEKAKNRRKKNLEKGEKLRKELDVFFLKELDLRYTEEKEEMIFTAELNDRFDVEYYKPVFIDNLNVLEKGKFPATPLIEISEKLFRGIEPGSKAYFKEGNILFLRVQNLKKGYIEVGTNSVFIDETLYEENVQYQPLDNDVLFSKDGTIGISSVYNNFPEKTIISSGIVIIRLKKGIDPYFLSYYLNSKFIELQSTRESYGTIIKHLNLAALGNLLVPIPDEKVQEKIATKIKETNSKISFLQEEAERVVREAKEKIERMILGN